MVWAIRVPVKGTIFEKPTYGLRVYSYNLWKPEGKEVVQFEVTQSSAFTVWVRMLYPKDPRDFVIRKKILKDGQDGLGTYFGFNYYGDFQLIYLDSLIPDKIIKK